MALFTSDNVAAGVQSVFGTGVTPDTKLPYVSGSYEDLQTLMGSGMVSEDRSQSAKRLAYKHFKISLVCEFSGVGHDILLKSHYGKYAFNADDPEANANNHVHNFADTPAEFTAMLKQGFTLEAGGVDKWYTFIDCVVDSFKLSTPKPGVLTVAYEIFATSMTEASSEAATGTIPPPIKMYDNFQIELKAGTDASEVVQSLHTLEYESLRGITPENNLTSNTPVSWGKADVFQQNFSFTINTEDAARAAVNTDYLNAANKSIIITMTNSEIITGAATQVYKTIIDIPNFNYVGKTPLVENGFRRETYNCELAVEAAATPFTLTNWNETATL